MISKIPVTIVFLRNVSFSVGDVLEDSKRFIAVQIDGLDLVGDKGGATPY
jgi:hypothetical protein